VDYNSFNVEVTKLRNELKNEEEHFKRMTNTLESSRRQLAKNNETLALNEKQIEDIKAKIDSNASQLNEYKEEEKILTRSYNEVKAAYEGKEAERYKIDLEQRQKRIDFDRISQGLVDAQVKIRENQVRAEQIVDFIRKKYEIRVEDYYGEEEKKEEVIEEKSPEQTEEKTENRGKNFRSYC
jgi:chromosome segregation ATPase